MLRWLAESDLQVWGVNPVWAVFRALGTAFASLSLVLLIKQGFLTGSFVAPLETMLRWYQAATKFSLGWLQPVVNPLLAALEPFLPWHLTLDLTPERRDIFVLMLVLFGTVARQSHGTYIETASRFAWGLAIAVLACVALSSLEELERCNGPCIKIPAGIAAGVKAGGAAAEERIAKYAPQLGQREVVEPNHAVIPLIAVAVFSIGSIVLAFLSHPVRRSEFGTSVIIFTVTATLAAGTFAGIFDWILQEVRAAPIRFQGLAIDEAVPGSTLSPVFGPLTARTIVAFKAVVFALYLVVLCLSLLTYALIEARGQVDRATSTPAGKIGVGLLSVLVGTALFVATNAGLSLVEGL